MKKLNEISNPIHYPSLADARDIIIKISRNIFGKFISWELVSVTILFFTSVFVTTNDACDVAITTFRSMASAVEHICFSLFKKANQHILLTIYKTKYPPITHDLFTRDRVIYKM